MLGWFRADAARASRRKRSRACGSFGYVIRQELQSDEAAEFGVLGLVDHTHAAPAELLDDAVMRDGLADHAGSLQRTVNRRPLGLGAKC